MSIFLHVAILVSAIGPLSGCATPSSPQTSAIDCVLAGGKSITRNGRHVACVADDSEGGKCRAKGGNPMYDERGNFEECLVGSYDPGRDILDHMENTMKDVVRETSAETARDQFEPGRGGTGTGGDACPCIEAARQGWRGDPNDHARFHCHAACVPGQTRTANCKILRKYDYQGQPAGYGARLCTFCSGS